MTVFRAGILSLVAMLFLWPMAVPASAAEPRRPHIVFILADDLGIGDIGCYGSKVPTPHIDDLARHGMRFEQADFLDPQAPSLPRLLKSAGYRTAHIGKWHLGGGRDVVDAPKFAAYGYDEHAGTYESPEPAADITGTDWIWSADDKVKRWQRSEFFVDRTLDFLDRNKQTPCFVNLWFDDVHTPWIPDADTPEKNANVAPNLERVLTEFDRQVGRLMDGLEKLGIADNTLVIFTSDNGPYPHLAGRTLGYRGSKLGLYEGGIRVPFIVRWPAEIPAGKVNALSQVIALDMLPTLCQIAGVKLPTDIAFDGIDQSPALEGRQDLGQDRTLLWEYGRNEDFFGYPREPNDRSPNVAVRNGRWKLLVNADGTSEELYDLTADPSESTNLAAERPDVAARLKQSALHWRRSLP